MRDKISMKLDRHIVSYLDHRARREGLNRSDIIRGIVGLPMVGGSAGMAPSLSRGTGPNIHTGRQ